MRRSERSTNSRVLRATLFRWDAVETSWSEHGTEVELLQKSRTPFASGECRDAYRVECSTNIFNDHSSPHYVRSNYVLKLSRPDYPKSINGKRVLLKSDATKASHEAEVASAMLSRSFADEWNNLVAAEPRSGYKRIYVLPAALVRVGEQFGTIEPFVEVFRREFSHFNDLFGEQEEYDDDGEITETLATFSHFTMTSSPTFAGAEKYGLGVNEQVVLDLQGACVEDDIILTDVQVCRRSGAQLGTLEIRHAGFGGFVKHHKCSTKCREVMASRLMKKLPAKGKLRQIATPDGKVWILK